MEEKKDKLDYVLVIDFEATCDENEGISKEEVEIIEFPTVIFDLNANEKGDEFHKYVKPTKHSILTEFCKV